MRLITLMLLIICTSFAALAQHPFSNDREGQSYILANSDVRHIRDLERSVSRVEMQAAWAEVLGEFPAERIQTNACAFDVVTKIRRQQAKFPAFRGRGELFIKTLRHHGLVDDVFLRIHLRALSVAERVGTNLRDDFEAPTTNNDSPLRPFVEFSNKRTRGKCLHDNFRELVSAFRNRSNTTTAAQVVAMADEANRLGFITDKAQSEIEAAGRKKMGDWEISLADYLSKRNFLRTQFPLVRGSEQSTFVTKRAGRAKSSHRMKLYEAYSSIQISLMGDVVRKLKVRLESPRIEINVHDNSDQVVEVITLDPMERFRFAIRLLRKEMRLLSINTYFAGRQPAYTDLMAAAFEMGIITAQELDEVARLEEIWNPRRTFLQKVSEWVRMFGGVLSIVIPPPFGFVPSLAMIGMQAIAEETPDDTTDSLF